MQSYDRATTVVRVFYAASLVFLVQDMNDWVNLRNSDTISPLWPTFWIDSAAPREGIELILAVYAVGAVLAAFWPMWRSFRILYFIGLLQYLSVKYGFGKVNHNFHTWLWTAGLFVFLPARTRWRAREARARHAVLSVIATAQLLIMFFYTLTGLWKVAYAFQALTTTRPSAFEFDAFALIIADRLLETNQQTILGDYLVHNEIPGWILFTGTMFLESLALFAVLRPRLHRLWGGGLIGFHIGTQLAMGFTFVPAVLLLGLLFLCSPFSPDRPPIRDVLMDLPGPFLVSRWMRRRSEAPRRTGLRGPLSAPHPARTRPLEG